MTLSLTDTEAGAIAADAIDSGKALATVDNLAELSRSLARQPAA